MTTSFLTATPAASVSACETVESRMNTLTEQVEKWDKGVNKTAKQKLYQLLQQCYQLHADLADAATEAEFRAYITAHNPKFRFRSNTSTISLILRTVFKSRRRQVSAYNRALLAAQQSNIEPGKLAKHIEDAGGVENMRLKGKSRAASVKVLADAARAQFSKAKAVVAVPSNAQLEKQWDSTQQDRFAVLVAERKADGSFQVHQVVQNDAVIRAALSKCVSTNSIVIDATPADTQIQQQKKRAAAVKQAVAA